MITEKEALEIKIAVRHLIRAEIDQANKGAEPPWAHADILTQLRKARGRLTYLLSNRTSKEEEPS